MDFFIDDQSMERREGRHNRGKLSGSYLLRLGGKQAPALGFKPKTVLHVQANP